MAFQMNKGSSGAFTPMSEINVTPFVDVMLVLLVIFMVTAPMMVQGLDVNLPETDAQPVSNAEDKLVLTIQKNGRLLLGETEISMDRLKEALQSNDRVKKDKEILLHADKGLLYEKVAEVMSILQASGVEKIGMITDPKRQHAD